MSAIFALNEALAAGVRVTHGGDTLVLEAFNPPPAEVLELLRQNKAGVLAFLENGAPKLTPNETFLPGWGDAVSMEYRLRAATEEECLEWAKELWQLELVAKARGYPEKWAGQITRNRVVWREAFAIRDKVKAPDVTAIDGLGGARCPPVRSLLDRFQAGVRFGRVTLFCETPKNLAVR